MILFIMRQTPGVVAIPFFLIIHYTTFWGQAQERKSISRVLWESLLHGFCSNGKHGVMESIRTLCPGSGLPIHGGTGRANPGPAPARVSEKHAGRGRLRRPRPFVPYGNEHRGGPEAAGHAGRHTRAAYTRGKGRWSPCGQMQSIAVQRRPIRGRPPSGDRSDLAEPAGETKALALDFQVEDMLLLYYTKK